MPVLTHLNNEQNRINKRINKAALRQASMLLADVPPPAISEDVTQNYNSLMKTFSLLIVLLGGYLDSTRTEHLDWENLSGSDDSEAEGFMNPSESDDDSDGSDGYDEYNFSSGAVIESTSKNKSAKKSSSAKSSARSSAKKASSESRYMGDGYWDMGDGSIRYRGASPSRRSMSPASNISPVPFSLSSSPEVLYGVNPMSARRRRRPPSPPNSHNSPSIAAATLADNDLVIDTISVNSILKAAVDAKFYANALDGQFQYLTKLQKEKLKRILTQLRQTGADFQFRFDGTKVLSALQPYYNIMRSIYLMIDSQLKSRGEGDITEYYPRTLQEMEGSGHICGSTTSVYGAGRKHRLLSPAMFAAHNVNDLFHQSLSKRNR